MLREYSDSPETSKSSFCKNALILSWTLHFYTFLKTFKASFYSSEKHFLFDNCGFWVCEIQVFLQNLAIVSNGNQGETDTCHKKWQI